MEPLKEEVQEPIVKSIGKWLLIIVLISIMAGSASALFLATLEWVSLYRDQHHWIILLLPIGGLFIGWVYYTYGKSAAKGNNLIIDAAHLPETKIPFLMAPLILGTTLLTHLIGGSAGREGTAIQLSGTLSFQLNRFLPISKLENGIIIMASISAGFSSVFGTPWAGALFGMEVVYLSKINYRAVLPCVLSSIVADQVTTNGWGVGHTLFSVGEFSSTVPSWYLYALAVGVAFGVAAWGFRSLLDKVASLFSTLIDYPPIRPFVGGIILLAGYGIFLLVGKPIEVAGLGINTIVNAFTEQSEPTLFALKLLFTALTLGAGFKGGEVTPLFFIGATLGSALSLFVPIPIGLMAGMGFVAVFAGATKAPFTSILMGMELFGWETGIFMTIACLSAYYCSGEKGIYEAQWRKDRGKGFVLKG